MNNLNLNKDLPDNIEIQVVAVDKHKFYDGIKIKSIKTIWNYLFQDARVPSEFGLTYVNVVDKLCDYLHRSNIN